MRTTKISIAVDEHQLSLARKAAKVEGLSLSAYIARALGKQLDEQERVDAARKLHAVWGPLSEPSAKEREQLLARVSRGRRRDGIDFERV